MSDAPGAIRSLEAEADQLVKTIAGVKRIARNPDRDRDVLAYYKTYLTVAPPSASRAAELALALVGVPLVDPSKCKTALRELLVSSKARSEPPK